MLEVLGGGGGGGGGGLEKFSIRKKGLLGLSKSRLLGFEGWFQP